MPQTRSNHPDSAPSLHIIGVGPGDPELITVKGLNALQQAEVVFAPIAAEGKPSIAQGIIHRWLRPEQQVIPILTPMVQDEATLNRARDAAAHVIAQHLRPNRHGAYIILGDPMLYGTFTPLAKRLREIAPEVEQHIVPGIPAVVAAAAATATPLASGSERFIILPGLRERSRNTLLRLLRQFANVAIMKAGPAFPTLVETLDEVGLVANTVYVENLGQPNEIVVRGEALRELPPEKRPYLSLMLVRNHNAGKARLRSASASHTYPAYLINLHEKRVVVVGGGPVGERKVRGLLAAGARPTLISPNATPQLRAWEQENRVSWRQKSYEAEDLTGARLIFVATDDPTLNARIAADAANAGILCNVADNATLGDFHVPAVHRSQGLVISVGTEGKAPARASTIRDRIAAWLQHE